MDHTSVKTMALIYTSVEQRFNKIYFRGYKDGRRVQTADALHKPTLYTPGKSENYKSLYGESLTEVQFSDIKSAREYIKSYSDVLQIHGSDRYEYDFIHRNFRGELNVDLSDLSILYLDIETTTGQGGIDTRNAPETVLLISCYSNKQAKMVTFGVEQSNAKGTEYIRCTDERDLLLKWINYCIEVDFDIMTGWNVVQFDMAYLGSRIIKLLGQRALDRLSPFGHVDMKTETIMDREYLKYEIAGRTVLDMLDLYKKFRFINRPNFKLDYISKVELGDSKTKATFESFTASHSKEYDAVTVEQARNRAKNLAKIKAELRRRGLQKVE